MTMSGRTYRISDTARPKEGIGALGHGLHLPPGGEIASCRPTIKSVGQSILRQPPGIEIRTVRPIRGA